MAFKTLLTIFTIMASKYQVRSISLATRSHQTTTRIEEELRGHQSWEPSTSSSSSIRASLCGLEELYDCVDDLLQMASTQQLLSQHQNEKRMDELLDGSVKLLDVCGATRDFMLQVKDHVFALQSALRRRKGDSSIETSIANYASFTKKMKKDAKKLISQLKQVESKIGSSQSLEQDHHLAAVIRVFRNVSDKNMSIFRCLLVFLAIPISKSNKWSMVSKLMGKGVVACESQANINKHELGDVDSVLSSLCKSGEVEKIQIAQNKLKALEVCIEGFESGLESVFKRLIKTRASLLNIISQ